MTPACASRKNHFPTHPVLWLILADEHHPKPRSRRDGWTLERQVTFLATLERTGNIRDSAAAAGMNRASAYRFRDRPGGERFRYAWNLALARRREQLLREQLAKAAHALARLDAAGKGDTVPGAVFPRETGKGDTRRETAQHRQPSQPCRFLAGDSDAPLAARHPNA